MNSINYEGMRGDPMQDIIPIVKSMQVEHSEFIKRKEEK